MARQTMGFGSMTQAGVDLGLGDMLQRQQGDETEEERKRRQLGLGSTQSPAAQTLLGLTGTLGTMGGQNPAAQAMLGFSRRGGLGGIGRY